MYTIHAIVRPLHNTAQNLLSSQFTTQCHSVIWLKLPCRLKPRWNLLLSVSDWPWTTSEWFSFILYCISESLQIETNNSQQMFSILFYTLGSVSSVGWKPAQARSCRTKTNRHALFLRDGTDSFLKLSTYCITVSLVNGYIEKETRSFHFLKSPSQKLISKRSQ